MNTEQTNETAAQGQNVRSNQCSVCAKWFMSQKQLMHHRVIRHNQRTDNPGITTHDGKLYSTK